MPGKLSTKWTPYPASEEPPFGHLQQALARYKPGACHNYPGLPDYEGCKAHLCFIQEEGQGKRAEAITTECRIDHRLAV